MPLTLEVSQASRAAIAAVEKAGGKITCVYRNPLNIKALLKVWVAVGLVVLCLRAGGGGRGCFLLVRG